VWPVAKSPMKRDGPKASTTVHGALGTAYHMNKKANMIADCLESQFASHDLCDENHEQGASSAHICRRHPIGKSKIVTYVN
jgi:hypothetical protein